MAKVYVFGQSVPDIFRKIKLTNFKRRFSNVAATELQSKLNFLHNESTREDVASFVRFNRDIKLVSVNDFRDLYSKEANLNKTEYELREIRLRVTQICAEYEYFFRTSMRVPETISQEDMLILLQKASPEARQRFLINLYFCETIKIRKKVIKMVDRIRRQKEIVGESEFVLGCFSASGDLQYGLWKNCLFTRFVNSSNRQRVQSVQNAFLWGTTLVFDWTFPVHFLADNAVPQHNHLPDKYALRDDPLLNTKINEKAYETMCRKIYQLCNRHIKNNSPCSPPFDFLHYNLSDEHPLCTHFDKIFNISPLNRKFYCRKAHSYLQDFPNKAIVYISPFAGETLTEHDERNFDIFVFSPFVELMGLRRTALKEMLHLKIKQEINDNVHFRRLPIDEMTKHDGHIVLSHYINCLHDVLYKGSTWHEALQKHISKKRYAQQ